MAARGYVGGMHASLLLLLACGGETPADDTATDPGAAPAWDASAPPVDCAPGGDAPLLDAALADAELSRDALGWTRQEWNRWEPRVNDPFLLSWFAASHHVPEQGVCTARQQQADLDAAAAGDHPAAGVLGAFAPWVDVSLAAQPVDPRGLTLEAALAELVDATGGGDAPARASELPASLATALAPAVQAIADAVAARRAMDAEVSAARERTLAALFRDGSNTVLGGRALPDVSDPEALAWFTEWYLSPTGPRTLADHARRIAYALEDADWSAVPGDTEWVFTTPAGAIRVSPSTNDTHAADAGWTLLHVELGGDDVYTGAAGANEDLDNPVHVLLDLGGDDAYGYVEVPDSHDVDGVLPSDDGGRASRSGYWVSDSTTSRQGAGRYGIGMLLDRGGSADTYASLRMSQGYGAMGVGVLSDDGGDDAYQAEAASQGAGVFGLGVLHDGGGDDRFLAWAYAQGFAYVGSGGLLLDVGEGSDHYRSDPGRDFGGVTLYASPQLPGGEGNSSFTQGAGFGMRADALGVWLAGGLGMLRDGGGGDLYQSGVFGQGTGYWEGVGLLADAGGDDVYDALYYVQGGAAHYAVGMLLDGAGNDIYGMDLRHYNVTQGSGHDLSLGVLVDDAGDDVYRFGSLSMGASNCQGVGVFVDNDGADTYEASSTYAVGLGNHSGECDADTGRTRVADSEGIFLDSGGDGDVWTWVDGDARAPGDDTTFGIAWSGGADEKGGAVDGDGGSGFRAAP